MVVGVQKPAEKGSSSPKLTSLSRNAQQASDSVDKKKTSKQDSLKELRCVMAECVAGEEAQPEPGISAGQRQVWGEVFQSRQNFVDMHCYEFGEYDSDGDAADERGVAFPQDGEYERIRDKGRDRLKELAKHKVPPVAWHTCVGPRVMWGTQEMMWPVSSAAMKGAATSRVETLATPKKDFQQGTIHDGRPMYYYSCGRSSVIWSVSPGAQQAAASDRLQFLAQHKNFHSNYQEHKKEYFYSCGRESPVWAVQAGARQCEERPRTTALAGHRDYHKDFQGERPIQSVVSAAARTAKVNEYVSSLAVPKKRQEGPFREAQWPVSDQAKSSVATTRCMELARAKPLAEGFQHAREVEWPVSKAAKHAQASGRLIELARPISRASMDHLQFNPQAFAVKETALKGVVPRRIEELAQPINR